MFDDFDPTFAFLSVAFVLKVVSMYWNQGRRPASAKWVGKVSDLVLYPVKSVSGIQLQSAQATQKGLKYPEEPLFDRTFMVINNNGVFKTARAIPKMILIKPTLENHHLVLNCDGMPALRLPKVALRDPTRKLYHTEVFGQKVEGQDCGDEAAEWINKCLNKDNLRIIYNMDGILQRELKKQTSKRRWNQHAKDGDKAIFHDNCPYLLASKTSLNNFNERTDKVIPMERFRPNIVVDGCHPFEEDTWDEVWIGDVKFTNFKPCDRCVLTTVDTATGTFDPSGEPLKTLKTFRLDEPVFQQSPLFGVHLVLDGKNTSHINVGDNVYVLRK